MAGKGGFIPGAGRKKGTPNRKTIEAQAIADRLKVDPFELLLLYAKRDWKRLGYKSEVTIKYIGDNIVEEPVISPELAASSASKACEYLLPKRKSVEVTGDALIVTHIERTVISKKV